ncbi:hypothetical protein SAMN05216247_103425 [Pseudomonas salomonii]|uniref:Uncharacterized protein n=1 Tax=Pseudomonas salomonii TaxID=191391 RepID=A0A1H3J125_9PSED|nr:hypothetical protein SAMN05216247_103425 [Pseudomonas salomonii]
MPTKIPQTANVTRSAPHHRAVAYDEQDIFFRTPPLARVGWCCERGKVSPMTW